MRGQLRIDEMFAFIVVDDDGTEGVPAYLDGSGLWVPLMGADTARVASLRHHGVATARAMKRPVEIVRFTVRERIELIEP